MTPAMYVLHHLGRTPGRELLDIPGRKSQYPGRHPLWQGARKFPDELDRALAVTIVPLDPLIDQVVAYLPDHLRMAPGARSHPGVSQFLAVGTPQLHGGTQRADRVQRQVKARGIARCLTAPGQQRLQLLNHLTHDRGEPHRVLHHPLYIGVAVEYKGIADAIRSLPRQHQHRRLPVQYGIGLVPVLPGPRGRINPRPPGSRGNSWG